MPGAISPGYRDNNNNDVNKDRCAVKLENDK